MQTFLPHPDFALAVRCLDWRRLGKQRVEARQIYNALCDTRRVTRGWANHPATRMWRGYTHALAAYHNVCIEEWICRGYNNSMPRLEHGPTLMPPWLGDPAFHASHRSNLLRKDPIHYGQFGWSEPADLPYIWPVSS